MLELAQALGRHPRVARVDLMTRLIQDSRVGPDYAVAEESVGENVYIVRLPCGPKRYLRKESLWQYLSHFADNALPHFRKLGMLPHVVHSHYADAGYVATRITRHLGVLHVHTGHSLGRVKKARLLEKGLDEQTIEQRYSIARRIEEEEITLGNAGMVVTSTSQEVTEQYGMYENHHTKQMVVIPPGVDLTRFSVPETWSSFHPPIRNTLHRFLHDPKKPMILALSRADERKNIATLVRAYGEHPRLRELANLVVVAGNRDDIETLDKGAREVLRSLLLMMDRYDLYGHMALPKHHQPDDVPDYYRMVTKKRGVFVNPALTEPFGLTLIEAAACGAPILATHDGGPRDIIGNCKNGKLFDPLDADALGALLEEAVTDRAQWRRWSKNGLKGVREHYTWDGHVATYLKAVDKRLKEMGKRTIVRAMGSRRKVDSSRLPTVDRILLCDIDNTLLGDRTGMCTLLNHLAETRNVGFGVATGRTLKNTVKILKQWGVPLPDFMITSAGSEIHYRHKLVEDETWAKHIDYRWERDELLHALGAVPGLKPQPKDHQNSRKISYYIDVEKAPSGEEIQSLLRSRDLHARVIVSRQQFLDILPIRASKGLALSHLALKWGVPLDRVLVAGDAGNDIEMLQGNQLGVVVANHSPEVAFLRGQERIYFAEEPYAWGILEGINHYHFFGDIQIPDATETDAAEETAPS
ncbi:putative sucrose-phosphate synthase [Magnetofaba australis IT-1]|uniref:sucrose-phosphate synthase n=1 Tax=Magnetofaba australis IT-1 TaxID=1434232 RepID=A0A1Y2K4D9_9PROT|nr:putative sucrose-phosphate synthase [Magnetofaba australis IT-1]